MGFTALQHQLSFFPHRQMQFTCYLGGCTIQYELLSLNDKEIDINIVDKEIKNLSQQEGSVPPA